MCFSSLDICLDDGLTIRMRPHSSEVDVVVSCRIGDKCPVDDCWSRKGGNGRAGDPGMEEVRGRGAITGGVVHRQSVTPTVRPIITRRASPDWRTVACKREHGAALREPRRNWGRHELLSGEAVDVNFV